VTVQLSSGVYEFLRGRILSGALPPLTRIKEQEVEADLKISRTPVTDCLGSQ
jgi:DNA-binding GntR family transcriptional regulator